MTPAEELQRLAPHLEAALAVGGGTHTLAHIEAGLATGEFQLWPAKDSVVVTQLTVAPTGRKTCHYFLAGGHLPELEPLAPIIEAWAKSQGCTTLTCIGRHGWARTFLTREAGWTPALTQYVKEL